MSGGPLFTLFGCTGFLGRRVVRHLLEDGSRVRITARNPRLKPELLKSARAEPVHADLFEPATLSAALKNAHGAVDGTSLYLEEGDLGFDGAAANVVEFRGWRSLRALIQP